MNSHEKESTVDHTFSGEVFTTGRVARICKVAPRTVSKWFDSGRLKGYRIPGSQDRRIPREFLIKFLKEHDMPLGDLKDEVEVHLVPQVPTTKEENREYFTSTFEFGCAKENLKISRICVEEGFLEEIRKTEEEINTTQERLTKILRHTFETQEIKFLEPSTETLSAPHSSPAQPDSL